MAKTVTLRGTVFGMGQARIAVPIMGSDTAGIARQWSAAVDAGADLIEWRLDAASDVDLSLGRTLRSRSDVPVLATVRTTREGGLFPYEPDVYAGLVVGAAQWADAVDIEQAADASGALTRAAREAGAAVVLSHHVLDRPVSGEAIVDQLTNMADAGAAIAKIAWIVTTSSEIDTVCAAQVWAAENLPIPAVVIGMGTMASQTRLGESARRSAFTFAVVSESSAPGQASIDQVRASLA